MGAVEFCIRDPGDIKVIVGSVVGVIHRSFEDSVEDLGLEVLDDG
jgi:hypothetical protein